MQADEPGTAVLKRRPRHLRKCFLIPGHLWRDSRMAPEALPHFMVAMRFHTLIRSLGALATLGSVMACQSDADDGSANREHADSVSLATAVAHELGTTLREAILRVSPSRAGITFVPGPSSWDTLLTGELRRAEPDIMASIDDSVAAVVLSTHGFQTLGDTAAVHAVVRSCTPAGEGFAFFRDSMVLRFIRTSESDSADWRLAEPIDYDHVFGVCEPTVPPPSE